jgi:sugar-specific transcriptional regulator TrmB
MYQKILIESGLTNVEAEILNEILENGPNKASQIAKNINHPRGVVYNSLEELIKQQLIKKVDKKGHVAIFKPEHPTKIQDLFDLKQQELNQTQKNFQALYPRLLSSYNLISNKPGISFFESEDGIRKVLFDTLTSQTEILTYADTKAINKYIKKINAEYVKKRNKLKIKKKIIVPDTKENRLFFKNFNASTTEIRFLNQDYYPFQSGMQIYDGKISYQTFSKNKKTAVLIEDRDIYNLHRNFFLYMWDSLK